MRENTRFAPPPYDRPWLKTFYYVEFLYDNGHHGQFDGKNSSALSILRMSRYDTFGNLLPNHRNFA